ncbi:MAG: hypothetical protein ACQEXV_01755 [Bacillota bacterium]
MKVVFIDNQGVVWGYNKYAELAEDLPFAYIVVDEIPESIWNTPIGKQVRYTDDKKFVVEDIPGFQEIGKSSELDRLISRLGIVEAENASLKQANLDNKESIAGLIQLFMSQSKA